MHLRPGTEHEPYKAVRVTAVESEHLLQSSKQDIGETYYSSVLHFNNMKPSVLVAWALFLVVVLCGQWVYCESDTLHKVFKRSASVKKMKKLCTYRFRCKKNKVRLKLFMYSFHGLISNSNLLQNPRAKICIKM